MLSLTNEHVRPDQGRRRYDGGPDRREGFLHGPEDPRHPAEGTVALVQDLRAPRGRELGPHEEAPVVGDVLDHAKPPMAPWHLESWEEPVHT
jgi:hypothetical protein